MRARITWLRKGLAAILTVAILFTGPGQLGVAYAADEIEDSGSGWAAPYQEGEEEVLHIEYENGVPVRIVTRSKAIGMPGRVFVIPRRGEISFERFYAANKAIWHQATESMMSGGNGYQVPQLSGSLWSILGQAVTNLPLAVRGAVDILAAIWSWGPEGMESLADPAKRYEFWKRAGIFEKYSPREIAFLNSVSFPLVAAGLGAMALAGTAMTRAGLVALVGSGPVGWAVALGLVVTVGAISTYNVLSTRLGGDDLEALYDLQGSTWGMVTAGAIPWGVAATNLSAANQMRMILGVQRFINWLQGADTFQRVLHGTKLAAGPLAAFGQIMAGSFLTVEGGFNLARLANAWGIPVPAGEYQEPTVIKTPELDNPTTNDVWTGRIYLSR